MKPLTAGGAGVDGKHLVLTVVHYTQYVAVATYKDIGSLFAYQRQNSTIVMAGMTANVRHHYAMSFATKQLYLGSKMTHIPPIHIAMHCHHGLKSLQRFQHMGTHVAGMPQFVAIGKECVDLWCHHAVRVRKNTYFHNCVSIVFDVG